MQIKSRKFSRSLHCAPPTRKYLRCRLDFPERWQRSEAAGRGNRRRRRNAPTHVRLLHFVSFPNRTSACLPKIFGWKRGSRKTGGESRIILFIISLHPWLAPLPQQSSGSSFAVVSSGDVECGRGGTGGRQKKSKEYIAKLGGNAENKEELQASLFSFFTRNGEKKVKINGNRAEDFAK